jgi:hypothetical protein
MPVRITFKNKVILPNGVISAKTDPVGDGSVLLHLLTEDALGLEALKGRL